MVKITRMKTLAGGFVSRWQKMVVFICFQVMSISQWKWREHCVCWMVPFLSCVRSVVCRARRSQSTARWHDTECHVLLSLTNWTEQMLILWEFSTNWGQLCCISYRQFILWTKSLSFSKVSLAFFSFVCDSEDWISLSTVSILKCKALYIISVLP